MNKYVLDAGLKIGIVQSIFWLVVYFIGINYMTSMWTLAISLVISISLYVYFGTNYRKLNEGFLTFKDAFILIFFIYIIAGAVQTIFNIQLYHVVDPGLGKVMTEKILETTIGYMERFGAPESEIDKVIADMEKQEGKFSVGGLISSYFWSFIGGAIIALIIAAIIKRNPPMFEQEEEKINE